MAIFPLPLIQEGQLSVYGERIYAKHSIGKLPHGGLPSNSVIRITDRSVMTLAVDRGRKATNRTNKE